MSNRKKILHLTKVKLVIQPHWARMEPQSMVRDIHNIFLPVPEDFTRYWNEINPAFKKNCADIFTRSRLISWIEVSQDQVKCAPLHQFFRSLKTLKLCINLRVGVKVRIGIGIRVRIFTHFRCIITSAVADSKRFQGCNQNFENSATQNIFTNLYQHVAL